VAPLKGDKTAPLSSLYYLSAIELKPILGSFYAVGLS